MNIGTPPTARNVDCMNDTVAEHKREVVVDQKMADARLVELKSGQPGPCFFLDTRDRRPVRGICRTRNLACYPDPPSPSKPGASTAMASRTTY